MKQSFKWIFAGSLAINLLAIGFIVGSFTRDFGSPFMWHPGFFEQVGDELPPKQREKFEDLMSALRNARMANVEKMDKARKKVIEILVAPSFDRSAFIQVASDMDVMFKDERQMMVEKTADLAETFTQDERQVLARFLSRPFPGPMGRP